VLCLYSLICSYFFIFGENSILKKVFLALFHRPKLVAFIAGFWTLLIFIACLIPGKEVPSVNIPLIDKWVHFVIFAGFTYLWLSAKQALDKRQGLIWFLWSGVLGLAVECLQGSGITTGRSFELLDIVADLIGGGLGVLLYFTLLKRSKLIP
jgi:VanZ family protein